MDIRKKYRLLLSGVLLVCLTGLGVLNYVQIRDRIPDSYIQTEGEPAPDRVSPLVSEEIRADMTEASANAFSSGGYTISYQYLGLIPMKETRVEVREPVEVIPGGIPIGIYLETRGILIIGTGTVTGADGLNYEPALRIVRGGDYIRAVNGQEVSEKEELIEAVSHCGGEEVVLDLDRDGELIQVKLEPVRTQEGDYKLGVWVRDNTQGIGTVTYVTANGDFAALGHSISDCDLGVPMEICGGSVYRTDIASIMKGKAEDPGEVIGTIDYIPENYLGHIGVNTACGIFGRLKKQRESFKNGSLLEVSNRKEIRTGKAWVRTSISGESRDYTIEIEKISLGKKDAQKALRIRVTDPALINLTGGIIQGLSGSPIIQNGKLIGAVTHVFLDDPTAGYGICAETMVEEGNI